MGGAPKLEVKKTVQVLLGGSATVPVTVENVEMPVLTAASGKTALVQAEIFNGALVLQGLLPGIATVTVNVSGTDLTETVEVHVVRELTVIPDSISDVVRSGSTVTATVTCADGGFAAAAVYGEGGQFLGMDRLQNRQIPHGVHAHKAHIVLPPVV